MHKKTSRYIAALLAVMMTTVAMAVPAAAVETPELTVYSDAYVVADAATGQILIEKNMNKRKAPASITKILTLALALEKGGIMEDKITVSKEAVTSIEPGSTHISLVPGEQITFRDAVMGTQLISANDAANVVAEYVSGTMGAFVGGMNAKTNELGLTGSHFANPNGLDNDDHYVTAYDMAQITRYALTVPGFREVFGATEYQMPPTNIKARNWEFFAQNAIMFPANREYYNGIEGGKLGYTHNANHTLVALAKRGSLELIVVALDSTGSSGKFDDAKKLLDYCFDRYETVTLSGKELATAKIPVASIEHPTDMINVGATGDHTFAVPLGTPKSSLRIEYNLPDVYKSERKVDPAFSVFAPDGTLLYTAPLQYSVTPVESMAAKATNQPMFVIDKDYVTKMLLVALKCLLVAMAVFGLLFFVCRSVVMVQYAMRKKALYRKKVADCKRRELAIRRSAEELRHLEAEHAQLLRRPVPNNVTHIYPNRHQAPQRRSVGHK